MTIRAFDLDAIFSRPASPFTVDQQDLHRRADLFEHVAVVRMQKLLTRQEPIDIDVLDGAVLFSAILFGALLDHRYWQEWLSQSRRPIVDFDPAGPTTHDILHGYEINYGQQWRANIHRRTLSAGRAWLDMTPKGLELRRWIADPLTHCLMLHWSDRRSSHGREPSMPAVAIGAFLRIAHEDQAWQETILTALGDAAVLKWRMRMPGFLVDMLRPGGDGAVLPPQRWLALLGRVAMPSVLTKRKVRRRRARRTNQLDEARRCVMEALPAHRASGRAAFAAAADQLATDAGRNLWVPVERLVLLWAADRLDPRRDRRQRQRPLAPSTIERRATRLLLLLRGAFKSDDPLALNAVELAARFNSYLASSSSSPTASDAAHLRDFTDWLQRRESQLSVVWAGGAAKSNRVDSGILTATEYRSVLARFDRDTANGAMARLLVILGFRAGLRWSEAIGLRTSDVRISGHSIELTVRNNPDYLTKSPAGRRVIPIHRLATDDELHELTGWWRERHARAAARFKDGDPDPRNRDRLFPRWTATFDLQLQADIVHAIREITGNGESRFHTLRHSCGSYLLATLTLPMTSMMRASFLALNPRWCPTHDDG